MLDVVIIGAGAAGLAAARRLKDHGASFRLLEAKPHIGGRAVTDSVTLGAPIDLGAHWLHSPSLNPLTPLVDRYLFHVKQGPEDFRVAHSGAHPRRARSTMSCFEYVDHCFEKIAAIGDGDHDCPVSRAVPVPRQVARFLRSELPRQAGRAAGAILGPGFRALCLGGRRLADPRRFRRPDRPATRRGSRSNWKPRRTPASPGAARPASRWRPRAARSKRAPSSSRSRPACWRTVSSVSRRLCRIGRAKAIADLPLGSCNKVALGFTRNPFGDLDTVHARCPTSGPTGRWSSWCARPAGTSSPPCSTARSPRRWRPRARAPRRITH